MSTRGTTTTAPMRAQTVSAPTDADSPEEPNATNNASLTPNLEQAFANQLISASHARDLARAAFVETVRDALEAGLTEGQVAKILKIKARAYIYKLRRDATPPPDGDDQATDETDGAAKQPKRVSLQPVIFLRGAGVPNSVWLELEQLCWARQWATTTKRQSAWHLARGGSPVVFVDFSKRSADDLKVAGVRAVYRGTQQKENLELINGGTVPRPQLPTGALDAAAVVLLIQEALGDLPAVDERRRLAALAATAAATAAAAAAAAGNA